MSDAAIFKILGEKGEQFHDNKHKQTTSSDSEKGKGRKEWEEYSLREDLKKKIWDLNAKNEFFTLDILLKYAKEELNYTGSRSKLHAILRKMGYKYTMVNGRKLLCEQSHVISAKIAFLRKYLQLKNSPEKRMFIYLDETWIFRNGSSVRRWTHETDLKSNPSKIRSEGKRYTILHAGCASGFLPGCDLLLDSDNNDRDYHETMNGELFRQWVEKQLIPALSKLSEKCVVIMDNAPYHSVQIDKPPNHSSNKRQMQEWLTEHNVYFDEKLTKEELWDIIFPLRSTKKNYLIDYILKQHEHEVLRLPPYHCEYNAIELAWSLSKNYYNKNINSQPITKDTVANLWRTSLSLCTAEIWSRNINHCCCFFFVL